MQLRSRLLLVGVIVHVALVSVGSRAVEAASRIGGSAPILPPFFVPHARSPQPVADTNPAPEAVPAAPSPTVRPFAMPLIERRLTPREQALPIAPDMTDAMLRIEGIYDPTRIGLFGPNLRMMVRPGTASMSDVFGSRWHVEDTDPNIHARARYLAEVWLWPNAHPCSALRRFRPDENTIIFDELAPADCALLERSRADRREPSLTMPIALEPASLPVFASPYPGGRFSLAELRRIQENRAQAIRARLALKWYRPSLAAKSF